MGVWWGGGWGMVGNGVGCRDVQGCDGGYGGVWSGL